MTTLPELTPQQREYEHHYLAMKKWNEQRAVNEKAGIERFYAMKETLKKLKP